VELDAFFWPKCFTLDIFYIFFPKVGSVHQYINVHDFMNRLFIINFMDIHNYSVS